ncbi:hypothetical protein BKA66DRAFT_545921 [Pyrenochaeta sp. MPI-SDFR-AT-0127]|nr:hypothetical protein BKA66DRAFT_545921 [Pyrenochaeta sp. MPI-SDFR-AT-0127]
MSGLEVFALVPAIIGAFAGLGSLLIELKKRKAEKNKEKKEDLRRLQLAVRSAKPKIQNEYDIGFKSLGAKFASGDQIARAQLTVVLETMRQQIIQNLRGHLAKADPITNIDYESLLQISHSSKLESISILAQQYQRLQVAAPIINGTRQIKAATPITGAISNPRIPTPALRANPKTKPSANKISGSTKVKASAAMTNPNFRTGSVHGAKDNSKPIVSTPINRGVIKPGNSARPVKDDHKRSTDLRATRHVSNTCKPLGLQPAPHPTEKPKLSLPTVHGVGKVRARFEPASHATQPKKTSTVLGTVGMHSPLVSKIAEMSSRPGKAKGLARTGVKVKDLSQTPPAWCPGAIYIQKNDRNANLDSNFWNCSWCFSTLWNEGDLPDWAEACRGMHKTFFFKQHAVVQGEIRSFCTVCWEDFGVVSDGMIWEEWLKHMNQHLTVGGYKMCKNRAGDQQMKSSCGSIACGKLHSQMQ